MREKNLNTSLKLAITKIGDLLLNAKITQGEDGKAIDNIKLVIPNYQRPYKWTAKNVIQLLDDIIEAKAGNKEVYRVGTLILHKDNKAETIYNVVDGQQRTITFCLLLKAFGLSEIGFLNQSLSDNSYNDNVQRSRSLSSDSYVGGIGGMAAASPGSTSNRVKP